MAHKSIIIVYHFCQSIFLLKHVLQNSDVFERFERRFVGCHDSYCILIYNECPLEKILVPSNFRATYQPSSLALPVTLDA